MKRILVATDGTESAKRAVDLAARIAAAFHASLSVLTVLNRTDDEESREMRRVEGVALDELLAARGRDVLHVPFEEAMQMHSDDIDAKVTVGDPSRMILQGAADCNADLIVLGHRHLHPVASALTKRVSEDVLKDAPCPILIVP